jgi:hypothetical protein
MQRADQLSGTVEEEEERETLQPNSGASRGDLAQRTS